MNYKWKLSDTTFTKDKGTVFSCFACGGGSSFGYKLAGFDVIGANDIDPKMAEVYKANHNPKHYFLESITELAKRKDLPEELYNLDILDGSPPCSSFSMAGSREKGWGKEKKFREGQAKQVLDTLFFDFIDLAKELQPKVVVAENVKGLLLGNAIEYVKKIYEKFDKAGYYCQHWLLNASKMGVPQRRERVFFICLRKDLAEPFLEYKDMFTQVPKLNLEFNEKPILFKEFNEKNNSEYIVSEFYKELWSKRIKGDASFAEINGRVRNKPDTGFGNNFLYDDKVCGTLTTKKYCYCLFDEPRYTSDYESKCIGSFPQDYNFLKVKPHYLIGMSVPPIAMANISKQIYIQWLQYIK